VTGACHRTRPLAGSVPTTRPVDALPWAFGHHRDWRPNLHQCRIAASRPRGCALSARPSAARGPSKRRHGRFPDPPSDPV